MHRGAFNVSFESNCQLGEVRQEGDELLLKSRGPDQKGTELSVLVEMVCYLFQ